MVAETDRYKIYYRKNKKKCNAASQKWKAANKDKVKEINAKNNALPKNRYKVQRYDAGRRGIEWLFTFETWWKVWEDSGKWEQRGVHAQEYCMCRNGDKGPYSPDNIYIDTNSQNTKDQFRKDTPNEVLEQIIKGELL